MSSSAVSPYFDNFSEHNPCIPDWIDLALLSVNPVHWHFYNAVTFPLRHTKYLNVKAPAVDLACGEKLPGNVGLEAFEPALSIVQSRKYQQSDDKVKDASH